VLRTSPPYVSVQHESVMFGYAFAEQDRKGVSGYNYQISSLSVFHRETYAMRTYGSNCSVRGTTMLEKRRLALS